ncbi:hypothetical protein [Nocardia macrotermitis]|uniref:hypothetical protein n=1 Tax=Nocardia macrotermitis TaxID=2585198 RepID=UPI001297B44A|nr:hypothetical protein [Nocardia macrotermitis]
MSVIVALAANFAAAHTAQWHAVHDATHWSTMQLAAFVLVNSEKDAIARILTRLRAIRSIDIAVRIRPWKINGHNSSDDQSDNSDGTADPKSSDDPPDQSA